MQQYPREEMQPLVIKFLADDFEEFAEKLTGKTLSYISPNIMRVRIEALRTEMYLIARSLRMSGSP